jgi:hypothetical protein
MKSNFEVYPALKRAVRLAKRTRVCGTLLVLSASVPAFAAGTVAANDIQNIATARLEVVRLVQAVPLASR